MSVAAQRAHLAYAVQTAKVGSATFDPTPGGDHIATAGFQRHKMAGGDVSVNELRDTLAPTLGGGLFIDGTYKGGVVVAGSMQLEPRLQNSLGFLLYAAAGSYAVTASSGSTSFINRFYVDQANQTTLPWLTVRRYTPGTAGNDGVTEYFVDSKVAAATMRLPQIGVMNMEFAFSGRRPVANLDAEVATGTAYEAATGVALSCTSDITLGFDAIGALSAASMSTPDDVAFMGAEITLINGLTGPREEIVVGSRYMDDLQPLTRAAMIRLIYKWNDPELYNRIIYAAASGTAVDWSPAIQTGSAEIMTASAANIGSPFDHPYKLVTHVENVDWTIAAPRLLPGRILQTELTAVVTETNDANRHPFWFDLYNTTNYSFS